MNQEQATKIGRQVIDLMQGSEMKPAEAILILTNVLCSGWLAATRGQNQKEALLGIVENIYDQVYEAAQDTGLVDDVEVQISGVTTTTLQ